MLQGRETDENSLVSWAYERTPRALEPPTRRRSSAALCLSLFVFLLCHSHSLGFRIASWIDATAVAVTRLDMTTRDAGEERVSESRERRLNECPTVLLSTDSHAVRVTPTLFHVAALHLYARELQGRMACAARKAAAEQSRRRDKTSQTDQRPNSGCFTVDRLVPRTTTSIGAHAAVRNQATLLRAGGGDAASSDSRAHRPLFPPPLPLFARPLLVCLLSCLASPTPSR